MLKGKVCIITGVSGGIGLALCEALLARGATVAGWGRQAPELKHERFVFYCVDIRVQAEVQKAFRETLAYHGSRVDIVVNNAGVGYFKVLEDLTAEEWNDMFATNVDGLFYMLREIVPLMKSHRSGHIVNVSSIAGLEGIPEATGYCGTKFAVRGLSKALFSEVRKSGIKVTCVFPGSVNTEFFRNYPAVTANETMMDARDVANSIVQVLDTPPNFNVSEIELRPLVVKYTA